MVLAVVLVLIAVGAVVFQLWSPWWMTPLASNWKPMDDTLTITLVITGVFFVAINLFVVYTLVRFRHREGHRAAARAREQEAGALADRRHHAWASWRCWRPAWWCYAELRQEPPDDAMVLEVLGQQWQWRFRFPGADGKLGADRRALRQRRPIPSASTPPTRPGRTTSWSPATRCTCRSASRCTVLLRSHDVLHDFFVPPFRARMNMVPGQVSTFWFTPTEGRPLRGAVRAAVRRRPPQHARLRGGGGRGAASSAWQQAQPTFAAMHASAAAPAARRPPAPRVGQGRALADAKGCVACHTIDGSPRVGPTWKGLYGKTENHGATAPPRWSTRPTCETSSATRRRAA